MNYAEIVRDFDALKQEVIDFKSQMTIDDFYFYEWESAHFYGYGSNKFEKRLDELCKKHFNINHWGALKDELEKQFLKGSKKESVESSRIINQLCHFFFGSEFSYVKKYDIKYKTIGELDWKGRQDVEEIPVWKGKFHVQYKELNIADCLKNVLEITKPEKQNVFLKNWRSVLASLIDQPWSAFSGRFDTSTRIRGFHANDAPKELTITDYTCFLALKNALRSDLHITTHENEILMIVSSGIAAKIAFRETSKYVLGLLQSERQIYSMTDFSSKEEQDYEFKDKTVLHISGYTDSSINMHIPNGYYFVDENYTVEVEFIAAPILLNAGMLPMMATADHASVDLLDDEEEERKKLEEDDY